MKKTICLFIIFAQVSFLWPYAQEQTQSQPADAKAQIEPQLQPAEEAKSTEAVSPQAAPEEIKSEESKEPTASLSVDTAATPQEAQGTVILRERTSDQNPLRKVARGAVNTTLGWVEIPRQMIKTNKENGDVAGVFWGPLKGFAFFVGRTAVGLYEVTTFLLPPYKTVVKPEFIFSDEDND